MDDTSLRALLGALDQAPWKRDTWFELAATMQATDKASVLDFLQSHPNVSSFLPALLEFDPSLAGRFHLTPADIDMLRAAGDGEMPPNADATDAVERSLLNELDSDLADILGDEPGVNEPVTEPGSAPALHPPRDGTIDEHYTDLIRQANVKAFAFDEQSLTAAINLYLEALKLKAGRASDWYGLAQAYLKRAQRVAGIFTQSFEGNYKDVEDFYNALDASKRAVQLEPGDPILWQNLATMHEIMNKKPMVLFCTARMVELQEAQQARLASSDLLGPSSFSNDTGIDMMKRKVEALTREVEHAVDPFDDEDVAAYERAARQVKLDKRLPLDHVELYNEALVTYMEGDMEATKRFLRKAIELKQGFFNAWVLLARILSTSARENTDPELQHIEFSDATRCIERAFEIDPSSVEPYMILADQHEFLDARDEHIRALTRIVELEPDNWEYREKLAKVFLEKGLHFHVYGDLVQARMFLDKSIEVNAYDAVAWKWLGTNYLLAGDLPQAIASLEECMRLDEHTTGITELIADAHHRAAATRHDRGEIDAALACIARVLEVEPDHGNTLALQETIIDDLFDAGFSALEDNRFEDARAAFSKAASIDEKNAFVNLGMAFLAFEDGDAGVAVESGRRAMQGFTVDRKKHADEFTLRLLFSYLTSLFNAGPVPAGSVEELARGFKVLLVEHLQATTFVHDGTLRHLDDIKAILDYFLSPARTVITGRDEVAGVYLNVLGAGTMPAHLQVAMDWMPGNTSTDPVVKNARRGIFGGFKTVLDPLTNRFLDASDPGQAKNVTAFIELMTHVIGLGIDEMFEACSFLERGEDLLEHVDRLATVIHVAPVTIEPAAITVEKTPRPVYLTRPHPRLDVTGVISKDLKLTFHRGDWMQLESTIFTGKVARFHASDFHWSPDGTKAVACENKEEKRGFKALVQGASNRVLMLDLARDKMIDPSVDTTTVDQATLERQSFIDEVPLNTSFITWKDDTVFQAVLKDGIIVRWIQDGGEFQKKTTKLPVSRPSIIAGSADQQQVALYSPDDALVLTVNLHTDEASKHAVDPRWTVVSMKWDNASASAHLLARDDHDDHVACKITSADQLKRGASFGAGAWQEDDFLALHAPAHDFYLLRRTGNNSLCIVDDGSNIKLEITLPESFKQLAGKDILNMEWNTLDHVKFYLDQGGIARVDMEAGIKRVLEKRVQYLKQFPRHTFQERAATLEGMLALLS